MAPSYRHQRAASAGLPRVIRTAKTALASTMSTDHLRRHVQIAQLGILVVLEVAQRKVPVRRDHLEPLHLVCQELLENAQGHTKRCEDKDVEARESGEDSPRTGPVVDLEVGQLWRVVLVLRGPEADAAIGELVAEACYEVLLRVLDEDALLTASTELKDCRAGRQDWTSRCRCPPHRSARSQASARSAPAPLPKPRR